MMLAPVFGLLSGVIAALEKQSELPQMPVHLTRIYLAIQV